MNENHLQGIAEEILLALKPFYPINVNVLIANEDGEIESKFTPNGASMVEKIINVLKNHIDNEK